MAKQNGQATVAPESKKKLKAERKQQEAATKQYAKRMRKIARLIEKTDPISKLIHAHATLGANKRA